jgi:pimeloyl-ACP methyl ester carboxylesterase
LTTSGSARDVQVEPYTIAVAEEVLTELRSRLARTRWPAPLPVTAWAAGTEPGYLKELAQYWLAEFDWQARQRYLNSFPQFTAAVDGTRIHFVHQRGMGPDPFPLVITHGWPSCFAEMLKLVPLLSDPAAHGGDPADAFDVVVPSLPGYGFSDRPTKPGMGLFASIARLWNRLITEGLGYQRYGSCGWDLGAAVSNRLGAMFADVVAGMYGPGIWRAPDNGPPLNADERAFIERRDRWIAEHGAYAAMQSTRPQTLAYGLTDSPVGLAAWMIEKFRAWSDCDGVVERRFSKDELLTTITIYWVTGTIGSSFLPYFEPDTEPLGRINVPTAVAVFPREIEPPPRSWVERACNIQQWTEMPRGGHFPAAEEPQLLAEDIRRFFRPLRTPQPTESWVP